MFISWQLISVCTVAGTCVQCVCTGVQVCTVTRWWCGTQDRDQERAGNTVGCPALVPAQHQARGPHFASLTPESLIVDPQHNMGDGSTNKQFPCHDLLIL